MLKVKSWGKDFGVRKLKDFFDESSAIQAVLLALQIKNDYLKRPLKQKGDQEAESHRMRERERNSLVAWQILRMAWFCIDWDLEPSLKIQSPNSSPPLLGKRRQPLTLDLWSFNPSGALKPSPPTAGGPPLGKKPGLLARPPAGVNWGCAGWQIQTFHLWR